MNSHSSDARFGDLFMNNGNTNLNDEAALLRSTPLIMRVARDLNLHTYFIGEGSVKSSRIYPEHPFNLEIASLADSGSGFNCKITLLDSNTYMVNESKTPIQFGKSLIIGGNNLRLVKIPNVDPFSFGGRKLIFGWQPLYNVAQNLIGSLKVVHIDEQSNLLTLSFDGENVKLGNDVLNTIMAVYDSSVIEDKKKIQESTLRFINTQLYLLSDTLTGVEGGIKNFMAENQAFDIEGQSKSYLDVLSENAKQKDQQEIRINVVNWLLNYINDKSNTYELVPTNLGIEEPALLQLVTEYNRLQLQRESNLKTSTPDNPLITGMEGSLDKIRRNIYQALSNVKQAYVIAGNNIDQQGRMLKSSVTALPEKSMRLLNIQRRQKILEDLYSLLLQKKLETQISAASIVSNSQIVEPATGNGMQISPDSKKTYTFYIFCGLLIPIGLIALREFMQDKVLSRTDVEKYTSIPILGEIGHSDAKHSLVVTHNSRRLISEQFRITRTNLQYIIGRAEKPVIMVTSSFSGEGKSFISTNMGAVMALSGKKTVIMEFDIRKPKIMSGLDLKRKMGITNYIIGKASFKDLPVKVEGVENLYVIPCGPIPPNPAEILLDKRLDELMKEVMDNFEVVILDTAPIGLVSDATNLGRFADCTLYIIRQKHTFRKQLGFIEELYLSKKVPSLCAIINDMKPEGGYYGGYYGGGYGYYTGYGYGSNSGYFENEPNNKKSSSLFKWIAKFFSR